MDYPAGLPAQLRAGYGIAPVARVRRVRMDAGNLRPVRTSADAPFLVDVRWHFSLADFATFEDWFINDIANGADSFNVSLANGLGMATVVASFERAYQASLRADGGYDVSATLRVVEFEVLTAAELEAASAYAPDDIIYASSTLHTLIHATLPAYW